MSEWTSVFGSQSMLIIYYLDNKSKSVYSSSTDVNLHVVAVNAAAAFDTAATLLNT